MFLFASERVSVGRETTKKVIERSGRSKRFRTRQQRREVAEAKRVTDEKKRKSAFSMMQEVARLQGRITAF